MQEVRGAGVVGEEPVLEPGADYEYTSGVPLPTPSGFMAGSYGMVTDAGEPFDIDIPAFSLDSRRTHARSIEARASCRQVQVPRFPRQPRLACTSLATSLGSNT